MGTKTIISGRCHLKREASLAAIWVALFLPHSLLWAATFTVQSNGDGADANTSDGVCEDASADCTLRAAIQQANATAALDTIHFSVGRIGIPVITPASPLPNITKPALIDATTQPSGRVKLRGISAGASTDGFRITGGGTTIRGFIISSFDGSGIEMAGAGNNRVRGCYIGTGTTGLTDEGNYNGIHIDNSPDNIMGGSALADRNVIAGNDSKGIWIHGAGATGNSILGNFIGLGVDGSTPVAQDAGVLIAEGADSNQVGGRPGRGTSPGNVISGHLNYGVLIDSSKGNAVRGNYIGTDAQGTSAIGNAMAGLRIDYYAEGNVIGGSYPDGDGNVISGNGPSPGFDYAAGIKIRKARNNRIEGNIVGPNASGTGLLNHQGYVGNTFCGVFLDDSAIGNRIGGTVSGSGNLISGNGGWGVFLGGRGTTDNVIQGNHIGSTWDGLGALPNGLGIGLMNESAALDTAAGPHDNTIGGVSKGWAGNTIAFNLNTGIFSWLNGHANSIRNNSVYANGGLGIDLSGLVPGVTDNDDGDHDGGANELQNFPRLNSATTVGNVTTVEGVLEAGLGRFGANFTIDFYASTECDPTGYGEGQVPLGSGVVSPDFRGQARFAVALPSTMLGQEYITATATDGQGNTSEFSPCIVANRANAADVEITASADRSHVGQAHAFYYDVVVRNHGPHEALGVRAFDSLPESCLLLSVDMSQGSWWQKEEDTDYPDSDTVREFVFTIGAIPAGDSATLRIRLIAGLPGPLGTTFHITSNFDPVETNNHAAAVTTVGAPSADLQLLLSADKTHLSLTDTATLTFTVINGGPDHCGGVRIDTLPEVLKRLPGMVISRGSNWVTVQGRYWWPIRTTFTAFFDWKDTVTATMKVVPQTTGVLTYAASVISDGSESDPNPLDNQAAVTFVVGCPIADAGTGDVNADGSRLVSDIVYLVNSVLKGGPEPLPCRASGDVNCDGVVATSDIIYLVNGVLKAGPSPCDACLLIPGTWSCP